MNISSRGEVRRGGAAIEMALIGPLLVFIVVVAVDWGRVFHYSVTIENCAFTGAWYAALDKKNARSTNDLNIEAAALMEAPSWIKSQVTVNISRDSDTDPTWVEVEVTFPFSTVTGYPLPAGMNAFTLSRKVRMNVAPDPDEGNNDDD